MVNKLTKAMDLANLSKVMQRAKRPHQNKNRMKRPSRFPMLPSYQVFPDIYPCMLSYSQDFQITGSGIFDLKMAGNSLYDPDKTTGGYQPAFFTELKLLYSRYRVFASKIEIEFLNGATSIGYIALYPSSDLNAVSTLRDARSQPYAKFRVLTSNAAQGMTKLKSKMVTKKIWGINSITQEINYSALTNNDPINIWYWHCLIAGVDAGSKTVWANLRITYFGQMEDRVQPIQPDSNQGATGPVFEQYGAAANSGHTGGY